MGSKKRATKKKIKRTSKIKGMKRCPDCKVKGVCKTCDGHGETRIVSGRNKGSKFERDVAKDVSDWTGVYFTRVPMSGGWNKTGDITPKDPKEMVHFQFNIECKNQKVFSTSSLMDCAGKGMNQAIKGWWKQCTDDAIKSKKIPLLVMTTIREPVFVMMHKKLFMEKAVKKKASLYLKIKPKKGGHLRVMLWKDFLKVPYEDVSGLLKNG